MITIFTTTKPFLEDIEIIQKNALRSWKKLRPEPEIILFGKEQGAEEAVRELGIIHVPDIRKNKYGTPLINDMFEKAQRIARNRILAYVNADIILMKGFLEAVSRINLEKFLMVGRRWDLDVKKEIDFKNPGWEKELLEKLEERGVLHGPSAIDYFVFSKGLWREISPFALGRTAWDNWLLYKVWISEIPIIDATKVIEIIHQNHSYSRSKGKAGIWKGEEAKTNLKLAGGEGHLLTIRDVSFILTSDGLKKPKLNLYRALSAPFRYYEKYPALKPVLFPGWISMVLFRKLRNLYL